MIHVNLFVFYKDPDTGHWHDMHAEIEPAWSRWRPWFRRSARWWWEIHETCPGGCEPDTWAYEHTCTAHGSGGAWTLRRAIVKAARNADKIIGRYS